MFEEFLEYFNEKSNQDSNCINTSDSYTAFLQYLGGRQYGKGMFRSLSKDNVHKWTGIVEEAYEDFKGQFKLFGFDWLGRFFGIDLRESTKGNILMFEIGTGDVLEIPCDFLTFLNEEIPLYNDACLASEFFREWCKYCNGEMKYERCAGYIVPLFLGGGDCVENLEDSDMEVYWGVVAQIKM